MCYATMLTLRHFLQVRSWPFLHPFFQYHYLEFGVVDLQAHNRTYSKWSCDRGIAGYIKHNTIQKVTKRTIVML